MGEESCEESILELLNECTDKMRRYVAYKDKHRLHGLSISQAEILHYIAARKSEVMFAELIERFKISKSLASQSVSRLIVRGYIRKARAEDDARNIVIYPTKKLEKFHSELKDVERRYLFAALKELSSHQMRDLLNILTKLNTHFDRSFVRY